MSAVATAPEVVTPQVSLSMVRNMIRLNFCSIAYARSLFPADCFKAQEIGGNRFKTLGGKKLTDQSKTFLSWVEQGVFDALNRGFLERCVLVISNEEGKTVEAWSLSVKWLTDSNGKEYAELRQSAPGGHEIRQDLKSLRTKKGVQRATMQMMRNVTVLTQSLPKVPERHTISMRVLYRDDRTPPEYEPLGFCAAPSDGLALVFDTPPLQIGAGPAVDTAHHAVAVSLITTDDLGDGHLPTGCERDGTDYSLDLGQMVDGGELRKEDAQLAHFDEEDEEQMQTWYFDRVVEILEDKEDGARVTTDWLAKAIGVPRNLAELFLSKLEKDLVTEWLPKEQARLVEKRPEADGAMHVEPSNDGHSPRSSQGSQQAAPRSERGIHRGKVESSMGQLTLSSKKPTAKRTAPRSTTVEGVKRKQSKTVQSLDSRGGQSQLGRR